MSQGPDPTPEQPELLPGMVRARAREGRAPAKKTVTLAKTDPVARVLVEVSLAHLDRSFDYAVPETMAATAVPGARVKVRFAGQDVDGFVVSREAESDHPGRLQPLRRVVSPEPVLHPEVAELAAKVAERYAGTRADVLRLAVPPRHATTEKATPVPGRTDPPTTPGPDVGSIRDSWSGHVHGDAFVGALADGRSPRAVWSAVPGGDWPDLLAGAAAATYASGRGSIICLPDGKDAARLDGALTSLLGDGHHVVLTADSGPAARYRDFLAVSRGDRRIVVGTRAAAFAPVHGLGLVAIWDDGDDLHAEPRAPYPHARDVLLMRSELQGTAALVGGFARTVEASFLISTGWAHAVEAPRASIRQALTVAITGATDIELERDPTSRSARLPNQAHDLVRAGLKRGPVLVQTPRSGYAASLACERCRTPARCTQCQGPLRLSSAERPPACGWCGTEHPGWSCAECGHRGLRAPVRGDTRTAEELGRSFPSTPVRTSSGDSVVAEVGPTPAIVVATPGAEPVAEGGYAAVVLMDTWLPLARLDLRTNEEALRRWMNAAALTTPGGRVLAVGDPADPTLQTLVRWDPAGFADRETSERRSAHLPPASRMASITGGAGAVDDAITLLRMPEGAELLGPVAVEQRAPRNGRRRSQPQSLGEDPEEVRALVRAPRAQGAALSAALGELQRLRSSRKLDPVRVEVDPAEI